MNPEILKNLMPQGTAGLTLIMVIAASLSFILLFITSYVKMAVVFGLLRSAMGLNQTPPNMVLTGMAIILSTFVMYPVFTKSYENGKNEFMTFSDESRDTDTRMKALERFVKLSSMPIKKFLSKHSHAREKASFSNMASTMNDGKSPGEESFIVLMGAFLISELSEAFQIGFLLFLPFLIIDILVANILMALGMHMLSPTTISLPFKLLLFVSVSGFTLISRALILSYG